MDEPLAGGALGARSRLGGVFKREPGGLQGGRAAGHDAAHVLGEAEVGVLTEAGLASLRPEPGRVGGGEVHHAALPARPPGIPEGAHARHRPQKGLDLEGDELHPGTPGKVPRGRGRPG